MKELNQSILNLWKIYDQYISQDNELSSKVILTAIGYLQALRDLLYRTDTKTC